MGWFSVTSTIRSGQGTNVPFAFRVEGIQSLDDLADELAENGCVVGDRFRVHNARGDRGGALTDRKETMLTREGIASVTLFEGVEDFELLE